MLSILHCPPVNTKKVLAFNIKQFTEIHQPLSTLLCEH